MSSTSEFDKARALAVTLERMYGEQYEVQLYEGKYRVARVEQDVFIVPGRIVCECDSDQIALLLQRAFGRQTHAITAGLNRTYAIRRLIQVQL